MVFSSWRTSLSINRILVPYVRIAPRQWRLVSTTSAINRGLRGSQDNGYASRGGRDHGLPRPDRSLGSSGGRSRPQGFERSGAPRRTRDDNDFEASPRNLRKPRGDDDVPFSRSSQSPSYASRGRRDEFPDKDRSVRTRDKNSGFRGQPGFAPRAPQEEEPSFQREDYGSERPDRRRPLGFEPRPSSDGLRDQTSGKGPRGFEGRAQRDAGMGGRGFAERRERASDERPRGFAGGRDRGSGQGRPAFAERRERSFEERPRAFPGRRDRNSDQGRRDFGSPHARTSAISRRTGDVPDHQHQHTADGASAVESKEEKAGAGTGLLRDVKTACKLIRQMQKAESMGEDTNELVNMTLATLRSVNKYVTSGKFQDEPADAVASLFEKKAADGTFVDIADAAGANSSVLFQRGDGKIELAARRHDSGTPHSRTSTKPESLARYKDDSTKFARNDPGTGSYKGRESRNTRASEAREEDDGIPISVPYTTAASEFLYGSNVVFAALKGQRRKLYNLYVHPNIVARESGGDAGRSRKSRYAKPEHEFTALAKSANVPFRNEYKAFLLDKMSDGRPHNGVVLEASKLPAPPVLSVGKPDERKSVVPLLLGPQSAEELEVNGGKDTISVTANSWRHPFIVMLDGILDPVNVGSIMRTCHFYGADAVAVATNTCAPLASAVLAKASSGACEAVNILSLPQPANFVHDSAKAGWKVYAAVAPEAGKPSRDAKRQLTTATVAASSPLADHPCILMLGAEGEGLRENLKSKADAFVSIERGVSNARDVGVDSMNVGVATGVLLEAFLRKPTDAPAKRDTTSELGF